MYPLFVVHESPTRPAPSDRAAVARDVSAELGVYLAVMASCAALRAPRLPRVSL